MNTQPNQQKGFTIIEVVLVLAIAGLIFLMIFIAWPALQKNQRDTAKKNDVAVVATALGVWKSNHKGTLPTGSEFEGEFKDGYVENLSQYDVKLDGPLAELTAQPSPNGARDIGNESVPNGIQFSNLWYFPQAKCVDNDTVTTGTSRQAAIVVLLESGNANGIPYCQEG